jgi:hypothetical protein
VLVCLGGCVRKSADPIQPVTGGRLRSLPEDLRAVVELARGEDFHGLRRTGERALVKGRRIPEHAAVFAGFQTRRREGLVGYVLYRAAGEGGVADAILWLELGTGAIVRFDAVDATF